MDFQNNVVIFHVDMDAFYPSIEQVLNPAYKGKPVIVGADPKNGKGRGVVASCSYEARKFGIHSGMPISQAFKACPKGIYLRPRFDIYRSFSMRIMKILQEFTGNIKQTSIDEAYLDFTGKIFSREGARQVAMKIKDKIKAKTGLTCSIGVSSSKIVAKIASDYQKPNGLTIIPTKEIPKYLAPLKISKIPGIGPKTERKMNKLGIYKISDLLKMSLPQVSNKLGDIGVFAWRVSKGLINDRLEIKDSRKKSISKEKTFMEDTLNTFKIKVVSKKLLTYLVKKLQEDKLMARTIVLKIRYSDFTTITRSLTFQHPRSELKFFEQKMLELWKEVLPLNQPVRLIGVALTNLEERLDKQKTIFDFL